MPNIAHTASRPALRSRFDLVHGLALFSRQISTLVRNMGLAFRVRNERRSLLDLNDHLLKDIGLDGGKVAVENRRPFWDLPADRWRALRK
jgi:uncharacterized protein YjiS (DUF1127 family)